MTVKRFVIRSSRDNHRALFVIGGTAVVSLATLLTYSSLAAERPVAPEPTGYSLKSTAQVTGAPMVEYGLPTRLQIPGLGIDAVIRSTGLTPAGDMEVPANIAETGWYKYGVHPGNVGSAVIAGHLIGRKGEPGVFIDLEKLQPGDIFKVLDDKQHTATFAVREIRTYGQYDRPTEVFEPSDKAYLNLITCAGTWDQSEHRYADRLVVFADKVD